MCLGIPAKIISIDECSMGSMAEVDMGGNTGNIREVGLHMVPEAKIGDYVLIHAGFAIRTLEEEDAMETLELLRQMSESHEAY